MSLKRHGDLVSERKIREATGGIFCIFHLYPRHHLPKSVIRRADGAGAAGRQPDHHQQRRDPRGRHALHRIRSAQLIIIRRNIGRDFGGYRTGVLHALERYQPSRLLDRQRQRHLPDAGSSRSSRRRLRLTSMSARRRSLRVRLPRRGSYALGFGPKVFNSPHFKAFWQNYELSEPAPK